MISLRDIQTAQQRIRGVALRTPLIPCPGGEEDRVLYFKPENLQPTGAFKLRGAYNKISSLTAEEHGLVPVPPYDDETLIAGQGTVGLEILDDLPDVETVLVPVSGGGLISGVAAALKLNRPEINVIGVEPELAADARASLRGGWIVELSAEEVGRTVADGLRVRRLGDAPFEHVRAFVDDIIVVTEEEILAAMRRLILRARLVAEPSGAVSFAGYLFHRDELPPTRRNVAVVSGGNVDPSLLAEVLTNSGKSTRFT